MTVVLFVTTLDNAVKLFLVKLTLLFNWVKLFCVLWIFALNWLNVFCVLRAVLLKPFICACVLDNAPFTRANAVPVLFAPVLLAAPILAIFWASVCDCDISPPMLLPVVVAFWANLLSADEAVSAFWLNTVKPPLSAPIFLVSMSAEV